MPARRAVVAVAPVTLAGKGLVVRGAALNFATPRGRAMQIATAAIGPATA